MQQTPQVNLKSSWRNIRMMRGVAWLWLFFFQAEDGIRDYKVTGVQTCALPIFVGGEVAGLEAGAGWEDGDLLIVEADESDGTFVALPVEGAIVTSVEPDHLEH